MFIRTPKPRSNRKKKKQQKRNRLFQQLEDRQLLAADGNPLILIPGIGGSLPADTSPEGLQAWYTTRGQAPEDLALETHSQTYQSLVQSLENLGYVQGEDLFVANWDWRLPIAPTNGANDGTISISTAQLTNSNIRTGLEYLGNTLQDIQDANPGEDVDIIAHGAGGLIARAYLQSSVYADELPAVSDLVLVGTPNEGLAETLAITQDDWSGAEDLQIVSLLVDQAYQQFLSGETITGPNGDITDTSISRAEFVQQYVESLRHLLPTFPSIDIDGDGTLDAINETNTPVSGLFNDLLADLNAGADPNAFIDNANVTSVIFSTETPTIDQLAQQTGPDTTGFFSDEIRSFTEYVGSRPTEDQVWFSETASDHGGDGTVPTFSSIDPFLFDSRIGLNLELTPITGAGANAANGSAPVTHNELVTNLASQQTILESIGATGFTEADIETGLSLNSAQTGARLLQLGIVNPADALSDAANRFRTLLDDVVANSVVGREVVFVGQSLASLIPIDQLWQDNVVTPLQNTANDTIEDIAAELNAINGLTVTNESSGSEEAIKISFSLTETISESLDLGADFPITGSADFDFDADLTFDVVLGYDTALGFDFDDALFIRDLNLSVAGTAEIPDLDLGIDIGGLSAGIENGSFDLEARVDVDLNAGDENGTVTFREIAAGLSNLNSFVNVTPSGAVDLQLPLTLTEESTGFDLDNFGAPVVSAGSDNLFTNVPDIVVDISLSDALQDQILSLLASLDEAAGSITDTEALNQPLPAIGQSLNELLAFGDEGSGLGDLIRFEQAAADYFATFDPISQLFEVATSGTFPTVLGLRNAISGALSNGQFEGRVAAGPLSITGGVDLATRELKFDVVLAADVDTSVALDFEALGEEWNEIGLDFDANAQIDVTTAVDIALDFGLSLTETTGVDPFFNLNNFQVNAAVDGTGSEIGFALGPVSGELTGQPLTLAAGIGVTLDSGTAPLRDRINVTPSGSFDLGLDFTTNLFGSTLPRIDIADADLFDSTPPTFDVDFESLVTNLSAENVIGGLLQLAEWIDDAILDGEVSSTPIPLLNQTIGELISSGAQSREFASHEILAITAPEIDEDDPEFQSFTVSLNTAGRGAFALGINLNDQMQFRSESGEFFSATVVDIDGETVTLQYAADRTDRPDLAEPAVSFLIGGAIGDSITAALARFSDPEVAAPTIGEFLNDLAGPLGINIDDVAFDNATRTLTITPAFSPDPLQYEARLDFGESIPGLGFEASGDFMITAAPTIRLPLGINLDPDATISPGDRVFVIDDTEPEVSVDLSANLDDPRARATFGFLSAVLTEDAAVTTNDGVVITTTLALDIDDPGTGASADGRATINEIVNNLQDALDPTFSGTFDIDGLVITPEIAGATIPGEVEIFTSDDGTTRSEIAFGNFAELGSLFDNIEINNSIGDFSSVTPEDAVTLFVELGTRLQNITDSLNVPEGIPFVDEAISEVVNVVDITQDFARQLYFNPTIIALSLIHI